MKNSSLWLAFFAGIACVIGLETAKSVFNDPSHDEFMRRYCAEQNSNTELCEKYAK
jgi:hypothetical protein